MTTYIFGWTGKSYPQGPRLGLAWSGLVTRFESQGLLRRADRPCRLTRRQPYGFQPVTECAEGLGECQRK